MNNAQVVNLSQIKDLLRELDVIRQHVLHGRVTGWIGTLRDADGQETVYIGGVFNTDHAKMVRAAMRLSMVLFEMENAPPAVVRH